MTDTPVWEVQLFAGARERAGTPVVSVPAADVRTIGDLRGALLRQVPALAPVGPSLLFAINLDYAADSHVIPAGSELACFPPVSGG